jgi:hypothetical protein
MTWGRDTDENEAAQQLQEFIEAGGNLVDTAAIYGDGDAERVLGGFIGTLVKRDKIFIATKAGVTFKDGIRQVSNSRNDLITDFNPLCLQHFVYGIILGKIGTEQVNKYLSKSNKFKSEDVDSIIWDIDILMQGDNEEYRQNDLILADLVNSNYENLASFIVNSSADTLIEFLVQLIKLVPDLDYSELHTILETFILSSNEPDSRTRYINYLIELGGEFKEHSQIENQNGAKKKGFLSKFLGR